MPSQAKDEAPRADVRVSVIVPTYHRSVSLYKALMSLTTQTYGDFEVVVVDDNAEPERNQKSAAVIARIREETALELNYIVNEGHRGSAETRNIGIRAARGEYITFLDDDDIYLPEKIERQLADMRATSADYGITDLKLYNKEDVLVDTRSRAYIAEQTPEALMRCHLLYHMTGTDTLMFRAAYLREIGGFPGIDVGDEFYLMERAILGGGKLAYSPHCFVKAYVHEGAGMGLSSGDKRIAGEKVLLEAKKKYFDRLSRRDRRYIIVRHYAVVAKTHLCTRRYLSFALACGRAFLVSPLACVSLFRQHG